MGTQWFHVLLVAFEDMVGLARLPGVLHRAGCSVSLLGSSRLLVARSRFVDCRLPAPEELTDLVACLREHLRIVPDAYDWVIFGDESVLRESLADPDRTWLTGRFPVNPMGPAAERIVSKSAFNEAARKAGLPVPGSEVCNTLNEAFCQAKRMGYPVILKHPQSSCGLGVRIVPEKATLSGAWHSLKCCSDPLIVQHFVSGQIGSTDVLFDHGVPICWLSTYSTSTLPKSTGMSCIRTAMDHPEIEALLEGVGRLTGFHGLGGVDWIESHKGGRLVVIEFNPRPTPGYHLGPRSGVDFSRAIQEILTGKPPSVQRPLPATGSCGKIYMFPQEVYRIITDHAFLALFRWIPGRPTARDIPLDDPELVWAHLIRLAHRFLLEMRNMIERLVRRLTIHRHKN
jgi:predicted ATP-grasp superfamily ATP-dependent carboligase